MLLIRDIGELRDQLTATCLKMEQSIINLAADQWRKRLTAFVKAKDEHITHQL